MSEQPPSALTRLVPGLTMFALVVMIGAAVLHVATLRQPPAPAFSREKAPPAPEFNLKESWFAFPETPTPGGWERPWGVDLFWLTDNDVAFAGGWNSPFDWVGAPPLPTELAGTGFPSFAALYAPKRRLANRLVGADEDFLAAQRLEAEDVRAAFDLYAAEEMRMRGFFVGGEGAGASLATTLFADRVAGTLSYERLFGGVIWAASGDKGGAPPSLPPCGADQPFPCFADLSDLDDTAKIQATHKLISDFSAWLEANQSKPAAPLPPIETIDIAPINQVDGQ